MDIVVGGGRYGARAVEYLMKNKREFLVLEPDLNCEVSRKFGIEVIKGQATDLIELAKKVNPEWIFPTAPVHVAAEVLKKDFEPWIDVVNSILCGIPPKIVVSVGRGSIVVSYNRDGTCLENCISPDICPVTKIKRPCPMFEMIKFASPEAFVLVSHQLVPGLGAIRGKDFQEMVKKAYKDRRIIVATACKCHGVITALKKIKKF
ncbi:MAG: NAD-binding protein [Archaeoglobales archaeon]|nr:NAD-binding protein [Archaeoglobales archaeon]